MAASTLVHAQNGPFKHIIIVVQENRTPDNLFGSQPINLGCSNENPFELGVDIVDGGYYYYYDTNNTKHQVPICSIPLPLTGWDTALNAFVDPDHSYQGWGTDYDGAAGPGKTNDGFCTNETWAPPVCPEYSYVQKSDVQPYFDIATAYGFANYMFQSNEGPSQPAHQFLFAGTSAPVAPGDTPDSWDFVADLAQNQQYPVGCPYNGTGGSWPPWVLPTGLPESDPRNSECYTHDSLVTDQNDCTNNPTDGRDYCDREIPGFPPYADWFYYVEPSSNGGYSIWDAPADIPEACYGQNAVWQVGGSNQWCGDGPSGNSTEWTDHIRVPKDKTRNYSYAPIFDDLYKCNLPAISWVIPDGGWSDHPGNSLAIGPYWVGDIVDAVGGGMKNSTCNGPNSGMYWTTEPTAIFVVWDDWGGWFDHVPPWIARQENHSQGYTECDPPGQWGCGYTDGFRVPLLVVSPYTPAGYVSGACQGATCPNFGVNGNQYAFGQYTHDFGSILAYIEWNFGMPFIYGSPSDPIYADYNAPDWGTNGNPHVPLSDFFPLWTPPNSNPRAFTSIDTGLYPYTCFQDPGNGHCFPWTASPPDSY